MFHVLIVDDEQAVLDALKRFGEWEKKGFDKIVTTTDSTTAKQLLKVQRFDAVFIDTHLPSLSAFDLIQYCYDIGVHAEFIILAEYMEFLYSSYDYARQAVRLRVFDYCLKPIQQEEIAKLLCRLAEQLHKKRLEEDQNSYRQLFREKKIEDTLRFYGLDMGKPYYMVLEIACKEPFVLLEAVPYCTNEITFLLSASKGIKIIGTSTDIVEELLSYYMQADQISFVLISRPIKSIHAIFACLRKMGFAQEEDSHEKVRALAPIEESEVNHTFVRLCNYIEEHYYEAFTLQELSKNFNLNYTYCCELFKKKVSVNFSQYVTNLRLEQACKLLQESDLRVTDISYQIGYNSYNYFANVFRKTYGMTPSQFRENCFSEENSLRMSL